MIDFNSAAKLLALCSENGWLISEAMKRRECDVGEVTMDQIKQAWQQGYGYKENGNGTHQKFPDQMAMKTVKNRLLKYINNSHTGTEIDIDDLNVVSEQEMIEKDVEYDIEKNANSVDFDESDIIDSVATDVDDAVSEENDDLPEFMKVEEA